MIFEDLYYNEITDASYQEMLEICRWLNQTRGYHPIIIGGWAVFLHYPTLGSRDIDILFPNRELKHDVVNMYLFSHDYKYEGTFVKEYFKEIPTSKRNERIIIDACSVEDINRVKGTEIIIPWKLAFEYQKEIKIEGVNLYIPSVEVLLLFKSKAALDREHDLRNSFDPFYIQQKIHKDFHDIATLISHCEVDSVLLNSLLEEYDYYDLFVEALMRLDARDDIIEKFDGWGNRGKLFISKFSSNK